ncbi:type I-E CRISPR-associated protein Cas6/Cse3/CasE [Streptomyces longisporoflavus]|uniref:type I-E CRISPR-associated protein Cas6/Cse3/CasE n=1 Tax=Streptomyces longisporoflavus TaxID=28044 RepID=UPI00167CB704|nr:type I-E CRISPR-associated protein Cas6/Cse3/CasE [Streptomyces longisporoflavus]GGV69284.1 type I-E CRISPR-associated protein Cas6/Cse3/CasE [Streptomyces longisporoflavus]
MYLTRFRINTARHGARFLLSSPQRWHAAVLAGFPGLPTDPAARPRILWRLDHIARTDVHAYIVSPDRPDLTHLVEQAGWPALAQPDTPGWETRHYRPFLQRLAKGDRWAFRLTANPVHSIRRNDKEPTKRTAHLTPRHQLGWLLEQTTKHGFELLPGLVPDDEDPLNRYSVIVHDRRDLSFRKRPENAAPGTGPKNEGQRRTGPVTLVTAVYSGQLEVTDPDALRNALARGIGRSKAYGCGLLTLAPQG